ncbi:MAG: thioesterase II family protein [Ginsengibacter sp.]
MTRNTFNEESKSFMKIVLLPFAGGNRNSYNFLNSYIQTPFELIKCEYPGHGSRSCSKLLLDIDEMVDDQLEYIYHEVGTDDYIIYGHSMGGLIGYELAKKIAALNLRLPVKLIVSGCSAPATIKPRNISDLPSEAFWQRLLRLGGMENEFVKNDLLREYLEPILRADLYAIDHYRYSKQNRLNIPLEILYSTEDVTDNKDLQAWAEETTAPVHMNCFEGNHFFIYNHAARLASLLCRNFGKDQLIF